MLTGDQTPHAQRLKSFMHRLHKERITRLLKDPQVTHCSQSSLFLMKSSSVSYPSDVCGWWCCGHFEEQLLTTFATSAPFYFKLIVFFSVCLLLCHFTVYIRAVAGVYSRAANQMYWHKVICGNFALLMLLHLTATFINCRRRSVRDLLPISSNFSKQTVQHSRGCPLDLHTCNYNRER